MGDSSEILPSLKFASLLLTIWRVSILPVRKFFTLMVEPRPTSSMEMLSSSTISELSRVYWISMICASMIACSFFASSYSAFSERSPCARASFSFCAISARRTVTRKSSSSRSFAAPDFEICFFAIISCSFDSRQQVQNAKCRRGLVSRDGAALQ